VSSSFGCKPTPESLQHAVLRLERTRRFFGAEPEGDRGRLGRLVLLLVESAALHTAGSIAAVVEVAAGIIYAPSTRFASGFLMSMAVRAFHG
jgi:hypothetical protein